MAIEHQKLVETVLPSKHFFLYYPALAFILGSANEALLMSNLLYWQGLGAKRDFTYKTAKDMYLETGLSDNQQRTAIARCVEKGFLTVENRGVPQTRHFKVNVDDLIKYITKSTKTTELTLLLSNDSTSENYTTITDSNLELDKQVDTIYQLYLDWHGLSEQQCRLTARRRVGIIERLSDLGYERLRLAVVNSAQSPYYNGELDGERRGSLDFIIRSYEHSETLANHRTEQ